MSKENKNDVLSQDEVDTLLNDDQDTTKNSQNYQDINPYDFSQHSKTSLTDLDRLNTVNDLLTQEVGVKISHFLCRKIQCESGNPEIISYDEYVQSLEQPSIINILSLEPLQGNVIVNFSGDMLSRTIEALFGGDVNRNTNNDRNLGRIELRISRLIIETIINCLNSAWQLITPLNFNYQKSITNPAIANITESKSKVLVNQYIIKIEQAQSNFSLCIPCVTLEPIRNLLSIDHHDNLSTEELKQWRTSLSDNLYEANINLTANIARIKVKINELLKLKPGDFIPIDNPETANLYIGDISVFKAKCGVHNGNQAVMISG